MIKLYFFVLLFSVTMLCVKAQVHQVVYRVSLEKTMQQVEKEFNVTMLYNLHPTDIKKYWVESAPWKFTASFITTMDNILKPLDLVCNKIGKDSFEVAPYSYYQRTPEEGQLHLDKLLTLYNTANSFEKRKEELKLCILATLGVDLNKKGSPLNSIIRSKRVMKGYTVENVAFESFPGYYITGSLYKPLKTTKKSPAILCPHGHFPDYRKPDNWDKQGRYRPDMQYRCAALARMGAVVFDYDMYAWGESRRQSGNDINDTMVHGNGFSLAIQTWNSMRVIDFLTSLPNIDTGKIGVTGASGGGTQTFLVTALDNRVKASVPVVMVSSFFYGGCGCESGLPIHSCGKYRTNNAEIAAMAAPRPQLIVSDGADWTKKAPDIEYPYLQKVYDLYGKKAEISNVHLPLDQHDYGISKRTPMYHFFADKFGLNLGAVTQKNGAIDESTITIEPAVSQLVFNKDFPLPANAIKGHQAIIDAFKKFHNISSDFKNY
jgi:dienelactone hydrolase